MKALVFDGKRLALANVPAPRRRAGEALVRVRLAGICSTDIEIVRGYMSFRGIPGHEFVGTVESAPAARLVGTRVVGEINVPCGRCAMCRAGLGKHCAARTVLGISGRNGAFAEYLSLPLENLHPVPAGLSDEEAAFAELVAAACEFPERVAFRRADRVLVLGDGRLAAMVAQVLAPRSPRLAVLGRSARKLSVLRRLGLRTLGPRVPKALAPRSPRLAVLGRNAAKLSVLRRLGLRTLGPRVPKTLARSQDIVIECTGSPGGLPLAARLVKPRGTIVLKSTFHGAVEWNPAPLVVDEITVVGSRCGPFETALSLLARGTVRALPFLSAVYPIERWEAAFREARRPGAFKVLMRMG
jgi:threonine dehydrogenase-like Zn-dependent dehydrogenase